MAAPLDVLMRPVKFVRGGAFLVMTSNGKAYRLDADGAVSELALPSLSVGPIIRCTGSSYHLAREKGVYLIAGQAVNDETSAYATGICVSDNTEDWSLAFEYADSASTVMGGAIVWSDEDEMFRHSFGVESISEDLPADQRISNEYEVSSADGRAWGGQALLANNVTDEHTGYRSPFPSRYCSHHNCTDVYSQNVPDGFMDQDPEDRDVFIRPVAPAPMLYSTGVVGWFEGFDFVRSTDIEIGKGEDGVETVSLDAEIYCLAAAGGLIAAGGRGLFLSKGDNKFEYVDYPGTGVVVNIIAVPSGPSED